MTAEMGQETVRIDKWFVTNRVLTPKEQRTGKQRQNRTDVVIKTMRDPQSYNTQLSLQNL